MSRSPSLSTRSLIVTFCAGSVVTGLALGGLDVAFLLASVDSSQTYLRLSGWEVILAALTAAVLPAAVVWAGRVLWELVRGAVPKPAYALGLSLFGAAAFGVLWHRTLMQGDGISAHPLYEVLYAASLGAMLAGLGAWTWLLHKRTGWGALASAGAGLGLWVMSSTLLPLYTAFHFYAVVFGLWCMSYAVFEARARWGPQEVRTPAALISGLALGLCVGAVGLTHGLKAQPLRVLIHDLTLLNALTEHEPLGLYRRGTEFDIRTISPKQRAAAQKTVEARVRARRVKGSEYEVQQRPRAKHVVVVVLESIRADSWADAQIAPRFAQWKQQGAFFSRAIAQYPATPLAYGAMFMSQTPYVLVHSPFWAKQTLLEHLLEREAFSTLFLSRPDNKWFKQNAIMNFIAQPKTKAHIHRSSKQGLARMRAQLEAVAKSPDAPSFFGWIHLYDAHAPYKLHRELRAPKPGEDKRLSRYLSEVRLVDEELGAFATWFFEQPLSKETLLVVISDHGEGMGDRVFGKPFWGHHVQVHQSVSNIPLFLAGPGVKPGWHTEQPVAGQIDLMPTVFDAIGQPLPERFWAQGRSLLPIAGQDPQPVPSDLLYSTEAFALRGQKFFDFVKRTADRQGDSPQAPLKEVFEKKGYSPKLSLQQGDEKVVYNRATGNARVYKVGANGEREVTASDPALLKRMRQLMEQWHIEQQVFVDKLQTFKAK